MYYLDVTLTFFSKFVILFSKCMFFLKKWGGGAEVIEKDTENNGENLPECSQKEWRHPHPLSQK